MARAVLDSRIPVVSGVGHETDFTICDFVADVRAPTPTGAAALVGVDRAALLAQIAALCARWRRAAERGLEIRMQRLDGVSRRLVHPAERLAAQQRASRRAGVAALARRGRAQADAAAGVGRRRRSARAPAARSAARRDGALERARERWQRARKRARRRARAHSSRGSSRGFATSVRRASSNAATAS